MQPSQPMQPFDRAQPALPGEVAWYATGRFYGIENGPAFDAGYFLHVQGLDAELFSGPRGEGTAYLTFLAEPFTSRPVSNGSLQLGVDPVGGFGVYLNTSAGASFDKPHSFGAGLPVARFRRVGIVVGATVEGGSAGTPVFSANVFSAHLVESREFELGGKRFDFARLVPNGVTQWGTMSATSTGPVDRWQSVIPFVGSAIAIGGHAPGGPPR
jgi:hypothetical protein